MFTSLVEKLGESDHPPFDFAVIDEAQDVGVAQCDSSLPSGARAPTGSSSPAILVSESSRSRFPGKLLVWMSGDGTDAPICQDGRSGGFTELLARAEVSHDALIDFPSEKAFQAPDDLPFGSAGRRTACDVINGRLMVSHADDDGSIRRWRVGGELLLSPQSVEIIKFGDPGSGR